MILKIDLIRHGLTKGNEEHRYVGLTDEPLSPAGIAELIRRKAGMPDNETGIVYVSPLLRTKQSAAILYPECRQIVLPDFEECHFGEFEYKNYEELAGSAAYQNYLDTNGESTFPGGESKAKFEDRAAGAFSELVFSQSGRGVRQLVFVCHGGCIMAVMDRFADPDRMYFDWQIGCGCGFETEARIDTDNRNIRLRVIRKINDEN